MGKNPHAVALGRKGGKIGGRRRAENLTPEQLSEIGRKGAAAKWGKRKAKGGEPTDPPPTPGSRPSVF